VWNFTGKVPPPRQEDSSNCLFPTAILWSKTLSIVLFGRGWKLLHATSANKQSRHPFANNVLTVCLQMKASSIERGKNKPKARQSKVIGEHCCR
jgi:hypothetical protein